MEIVNTRDRHLGLANQSPAPSSRTAGPANGARIRDALRKFLFDQESSGAAQYNTAKYALASTLAPVSETPYRVITAQLLPSAAAAAAAALACLRYKSSSSSSSPHPLVFYSSSSSPSSLVLPYPFYTINHTSIPVNPATLLELCSSTSDLPLFDTQQQ